LGDASLGSGDLGFCGVDLSEACWTAAWLAASWSRAAFMACFSLVNDGVCGGYLLLGGLEHGLGAIGGGLGAIGGLLAHCALSDEALRALGIFGCSLSVCLVGSDPRSSGLRGCFCGGVIGLGGGDPRFCAGDSG